MNSIERNSVWRTDSEEIGIPEGQYRILEVSTKYQMVVLFRLDIEKGLNRPIHIELSQFWEGVEDNLLTKSHYDLPISKKLSEEDMPQNWISRRDAKYQLISDLVENDRFLIELVSRGKSPEIVRKATELEIHPNVIYRALNDYWRYGQNKGALTPNYSKCGAPGKRRKRGNGIIGRPKKQPQYNFSKRTIYPVTEEEQQRIRKAIELFHVKKKEKVIANVYSRYLELYHKTEVEEAERNGRKPDVPTIEQFRYWKRKLYDWELDEKARIGAPAHDMQNRDLLNSVSDLNGVPGSSFEIDATIADVFLVSPFDRKQVLGRPVIYAIVDVGSRMLAGFYVGLDYPSWNSAKQALLNAFLPKKPFCAKYGVTIEDEDWPCHHLPRSLMCDRGEMLGLKSQAHVSPMGIRLDWAAAGRADWKSVVERRFGICNELIHELEGTTKGKPKKRMDPDPKKDSLFTIREFVALLINDFLLFHKTRKFDDLLIPELIAQNKEWTPIEYWKQMISEQRHALTKVDEEQAIAELLKEVNVSVTSKGFKLGERYYTNEVARADGWFSEARRDGRYKVKGRADDSDSNFIYVRKDRGSPLLKCSLLPRSQDLFQDLHLAEIIYIEEWKREKSETGSELLGKIARVENIESATKAAKKKRKESVGNFKEQPNNVREVKRKRAEFQSSLSGKNYSSSKEVRDKTNGDSNQVTIEEIETIIGDHDE